MQARIADVVAVAEARAQLRTAVLHAGIVIGTLRHVDAPGRAVRPQLRRCEARRRAKGRPRRLDENAGDESIQPRHAQRRRKRSVRPDGQLLHIAVDGAQRLILRHDRLQRLIGRDPRQDLSPQMLLLLPARAGILRPQRPQSRVKGGVQLRRLRGKPLRRGPSEILSQIVLLHLRIPFPFRFAFSNRRFFKRPPPAACAMQAHCSIRAASLQGGADIFPQNSVGWKPLLTAPLPAAIVVTKRSY